MMMTATTVMAHPVPRDNHDRTIVVHVSPDGVRIDYRLEVDEFRALRDLDEGEVSLANVRSRAEVHAAYLRTMAPLLLNNVVLRVDEKERELRLVEQRYQLLDHVRCDYRFAAPWQLAAGQCVTLTVYDGNFAADSASAIRLSLESGPQLTVTDVVVPDGSPTQSDRARRTLSARVCAVPSQETGVVRGGLPPDLPPYRPAAGGRWRGSAGVSKPILGEPGGVARAAPTQDAGDAEGGGLLDLLLDSRQGLGVLLLLAAGFGAVHALTPGHGKTMVAAYLVGQRGTMGHAVLLGVVTTLTHTAAVLLIAAVLPLLFPDAVPATVQATLGLVGGGRSPGLGLWLLLKRLTGRSDHLHLPGGHTHDGEPADGRDRPTVWGLIVLGVSGGIVPCWDAIAMLELAISTQRRVAGTAAAAGVQRRAGGGAGAARHRRRPRGSSPGRLEESERPIVPRAADRQRRRHHRHRRVAVLRARLVS
ncbi:MAG: hypothetical protein U0736_17885 [Gemmataceae bacterium]